MKNIYRKLTNNIGAVILIAILGLVLMGATYVNLGPTSLIDGDIGITTGHGYYIDDIECIKYSKFNATTAPTVNNDVDEGYLVGSVWVDITNDKAYICLDNTDGAAVWIETTGSGGGASTYLELTDTPAAYDDGKYAKSTAAGVIWDTPAGGGTVTTSGTPVQYDYARFTDATTIEGREYSEVKTDLAYQLSDMSDVGATTPTDKYALMADGDSWESRALVEADISDLGTYLTDITGESVGSLSDIDLTDIANEKILQYNSTSSKWECEDAGAGGGETNTASNIGSQVEIYKQKTGVDFELRTLKANSNQITVTNTTNNTVDVGNPATDRSTTNGSRTMIDQANPANVSGTIDTVEIWANLTMSNCKVATFYVVSGNNLSTRDTHTIGSVTAGSKQTFSGLSIDVEAGDFIGIYYSSGAIEYDNTGGTGVWYLVSDQIPCTNVTFTDGSGERVSVYASGSNPTTHDYIYFDVNEGNIKLDNLGTPDDNTDLNASTTAHGLLKKLDNNASNFMNGQGNWAAPSGGGTVTTSGTPVANDIARFTGATVIEGLSYAEFKAALDLEIGTDVQAYDAALTNISALTYVSPSFIKLTADDTYAVRTIAETKTDLSLNNVTNVATDDTAYDATTWDGNNDAATKNAIRDKIETMGAGYTNLTSFVDQTAWRVFYSNTAGDVTELALGADGTYLKSNGAAAAPTFATPAGSGDVSKVGTPVDNQVGVWTGDGTIEGTSGLTYDGANLQLTGDIGSTGTRITKGWFTDLTVTNAIAGSITGNARGLVSVSNSDITSQPNGTGRTIIYAPSTVVTTKTTTATLTVAEAGTVLVSASAAYTITLPTASGNTGLTYHFKKTDANYNLITLDGDGSETFNYENSTSAPKTTYNRLNTYCAEVTVVSDGSNWQVISEAMGQVPECLVYMSTNQVDLPDDMLVYACFDTESYDIGSNYNNSTLVSGNMTSYSASHLVDSGGAFTAAMVGKYIKNTTDSTGTYVSAYNSATDLTLKNDIFDAVGAPWDAYEIENAKFVAPISGKYIVYMNLGFLNIEDGDRARLMLQKNHNEWINCAYHASTSLALYCLITEQRMLTKDDYIEGGMWLKSGINTIYIRENSTAVYTYMHIYLISKD